MKVIDYAVCQGDDVEELREVVLEMIKEDWQPVGGVQVVLIEKSEFFDRRVIAYQAMVKYETVSFASDFRAMQMWVGG